MRPLLTTICLFFVLSGCSATKETFLYIDPVTQSNTEKESNTAEEDTAAPKKPRKAVKVDRSQPATFDEYRQWREQNDPSGQTYAEYKAWEAAYKQWIENQAKAIQ